MRWTNLNVHQLDTVFERFIISNVIQPVYDRRLSRIEDLCKAQLVSECKRCSLNHTGLKHKLIERLFKHHGPNHMVRISLSNEFSFKFFDMLHCEIIYLTYGM